MQTTIAHNILLATALTTPALLAGEPTPEPTAAAVSGEKSRFDDLWSLATLYKNDANPILQEFKLRGRYQGQYHWLDSDEGDAHDWEHRRSRFGFDAKLFEKKIEIRLDAQSSPEFDPFYDRLVDAYIKWKPTDSFSVTAGRQKPQIGYYDWLQSTNAQPTFERSQIFNQLRVDRATGLVAEGNYGAWTWQAGAYSNDIDREFGGLDGGWSYGAGIGYSFSESWGFDKADWRLDWLHSDHDNSTDSVLNRYENLLSTTLWIQSGGWNVVTEAFYATGGEERDGDVFGLFVQPTYDVIPKKLQLVGRLTWTTGDGADSVIAQSRYEREAPALTAGGRGDSYFAAYLGLQHFIHGDKLKLLAGAEYAHLDGGGNGGDFQGVTFLTGLRLSF